MAIRVMIVDDDLTWVKVLSSFLSTQEDIIVVCTATNKQEALKLAKDMVIDIILMDINLSENQMDGIVTSLNIAKFSKSKIIMVTSYYEKDLIKDSFAAGAIDYISKEDYLNIPMIIRKAYYGNLPIEVLLNDYERLRREELLKVLTSAEREIFELIEQGYTQFQIEKKLFKTKNTIRTQVKHILRKLQVKSCREAIEKVRAKGIAGIES